MRAVLVERAWSIRVQNIELSLSCLTNYQIVLCPIISLTSLKLFFINWKWSYGASEPDSSNKRTKQRCVNMPFQRESEMDSLSYEDFPAQLDRKLTYGDKSQTQLTLV